MQERQAPLAPRQAVGTAIQDLVAARVGRGLIPLALLLLWGVVQLVRDSGGPQGLVLSLGALVAGATLLAYGLRVVQRAFGRPDRIWMVAATWGSVVPFVFALYVLGWRGLRVLVAGGSPTGLLVGIGFAGMGSWVLRSWMTVIEVGRLARIMTLDLDEGRGSQ